MTFEEYLVQKKIDGVQFRATEPDLYSEWKSLFEQMHPESFTTHKKFLINKVRRKYLLR